MKLMNLCLSISLVMMAHSAVAAPRVNSGGGGWACRHSVTGEIQWVKAADLTKVEYYGKSLFSEQTGVRWELLRKWRKMISTRVPQLAKLLNDHPLKIENKMLAIPTALDYVADAQLRYKPPGSSCPNGIVSYVQLADTAFDGKVVYSERVWASPAFSEFHKAAILLHEELYFSLRHSHGDGSSYRTRQIMGLLFSVESDRQLQNQVAIVLSTPSTGRRGIFGYKNGPALFNVKLGCSVMLNGESPILPWSPKTHGESTEFTSGTYQFRIVTSGTDGSPQSLEIKDLNTGAKALTEGEDAAITFNATARLSVTLQAGAGSKAQLTCTSRHPLDNDPL